MRLNGSETAVEVLRELEFWLNWQERESYTHEATRLWAILSALRGPDSGNSQIKEETTAIIRRRALGKSMSTSVVVATLAKEDLAPLVSQWNEGHFWLHIRAAATRLTTWVEEAHNEALAIEYVQQYSKEVN